jgi:hypothetical protein
MHGLPQFHDRQNCSISHMSRPWSVHPVLYQSSNAQMLMLTLLEIEPTFNAETIRKGFFLSSLDVHNPGHEAGLPEEDFKAIFYVCEQCDRYMTRRVSPHHNGEEDPDAAGGSHRWACIYLRKQVKRILDACKNSHHQPELLRKMAEFPTLEPL